MEQTVCKTRTLITGEKVEESPSPVKLSQVCTKCPRKWALVDTENGSVFGWQQDGTGYTSTPFLVELFLEHAIAKMHEHNILADAKKKKLPVKPMKLGDGWGIAVWDKTDRKFCLYGGTVEYSTRNKALKAIKERGSLPDKVFL